MIPFLKKNMSKNDDVTSIAFLPEGTPGTGALWML